MLRVSLAAAIAAGKSWPELALGNLIIEKLIMTTHCSKNNLNVGKIKEPVTARADATEYVRQLFTYCIYIYIYRLETRHIPLHLYLTTVT